MPQVSIIIATYNPDNQKLKATLNGVCKQHGISFEIIITDDASKQKDFSFLPDFFSSYGIENYRIIEHEKNGGTVKNCLDGVAAARGKYVFITSPGDILFDENVLSDFYHFAEENEADLCFGNAVYYSNEENGPKITRQYGAPLMPQLYSPANSFNQKCEAFFGCDWIVGAVYFRKTSTAKKYLEQVVDVCRYTEDSSSTAFALADGVDVLHFNRNMVWYEDGTGISTAKKSKWQKVLDSENQNAIKKLKKAHPQNPYVDFLYSNLTIKNKALRNIKKLITHPILSIKIIIKKKITKKQQITYTQEDLKRLKDLLS